MIKNILFIAIPLTIYLILSNFIFVHKDLVLVTLLITTIIFWASSIIPGYQTSMIFLFTALIFSLSSKEIVFSGFSSSAFWLVFAGMLIATAIKNVNLSDRLSSFFYIGKSQSYLKILIIINIFSVMFSFIMPSSVGRVILLIPIANIVAKNFGFKPNDKGYIGIIFTFILSTAIPAFAILPANVPNMILSGLTHEIYNIELLYSYYFLANFIVLGFIKNFFIVALIYYFYKDNPKPSNFKYQKKAFSKEEKIVIATTLMMLLCWMTDFIHGISASIIAVSGVLFLANPAINIIKTKDINSLNFASLLFVAAIISLGNIVENSHFIKDLLSNMINLFEPTKYEVLNYMIITSFMTTSAIFTTQPTIPAIYTPLANQISAISGFSLNEIFMMEVAAFSNIFFPFQTAPLFIGLALTNIKQIKLIKILFLLAAITIFILYPLEYYWMQFIENIF